jgi:ABC-2 type transport system permease protein
MAVRDEGLYQGGLSGLAPWRRVVVYREALGILAARNLKLRYRRSVLGFAWTLAYPVLATAVLSFVFAPVFPRTDQYPVYVVIGVLVWHFVSVSAAQAMDALIAGAGVMRKVYVPSAVFPLASVVANLANFLLCIAVIPVTLALLGAGVTLRPFELVAGIVGLVGFTAGLSLALAALHLFFRDVRPFFEAVLLLWFYATPIVYPTDALPDGVVRWLMLNPLYWIVTVVRGGVCVAVVPTSATVVACMGMGLATFLLGWRLYVKVENRFHLYW